MMSISQEFKICVLRQFTSSATYMVLPQMQLHIDHYAVDPAVDLALLGMGSDNEPSASRLSFVDEETRDSIEWYEPDQMIVERAQERLAALRRQAAETIASDDGTPYEWSSQGVADMRTTLRAAHRSQRRALGDTR